MKELNEDFIPIVRGNFYNVKGKAKQTNVTYRFNKEKFKKRALSIGLACVALISIGGVYNSKLGKEIINGLKIERILSDTYHTNNEFKEKMDKLGYCYDAGYGVPILNGIYEPFNFGTPECDSESCTVCSKNRKIRMEIDEILSENPVAVLINSYTTGLAPSVMPPRKQAEGGLRRKHPHAGGEDQRFPVLVPSKPETPPRGWGRLIQPRPNAHKRRNTPTRVGKTRNGDADRRTGGKHPHAGGEDVCTSFVIVKLKETPPRGWGRPQGFSSCFRWWRNTPTRVGKTPLKVLCAVPPLKHPHAGGEDSDSNPRLPREWETPPRGWGRQNLNRERKEYNTST